MENKRITLVILDNTLGAGKTTLLENLIARNPTWFRIDEGVSLEKKNKIVSVDNPEHREYVDQFIQSKVAVQYGQALTRAIPGDIIVADRIFSASKYWSKYYGGEAAPYTQFLIDRIKYLLRENNVKIIYIWLHDYTETKRILIRNIRKRGREFEQGYTSVQLIQLEKIYRECVNDLHGLDHECHSIDITDDFYKCGYLVIEGIIRDDLDIVVS